MSHLCSICRQAFTQTNDDLRLLETIGAPVPVECPDCRRQRRLLFRNFFHLYHRTCDLSGKRMLSMYDEQVPFSVYEMHEWWSDKWDGKQYGIEIDSTKPAFEHMRTLHRTVPRMNLSNILTENCDYCNMSLESRNCYLMFGNVSNEDCCYGHIVWQSTNCFDCLYCYRSQFCYECIDCVGCHTVAYSRDSDNCSDAMFLVHCQGCRHCFGCVGLKNKEYCIFNVQHSKEEYQEKLSQMNTGNRRTIEAATTRVESLVGKEIVKNYHGFNCENVTGDYLYNCKHIHEGYDLKNCEDCRYCATAESLKDSQDCNFSGATNMGELTYNCLTSGGGYNMFCCHNCMNGCANLFYCDNCPSSKDCFGCVGLKNQRYCIFNRQYTEQEYGSRFQGLIDRMKNAGDWGKFFPHAFTPFAYNETIAQVYFPLSEKDVLARGWRWKNPEEIQRQESYLGPEVKIPDDIHDADDSICNKILRCDETAKLYKIIPQELRFLQEMNLPLPRTCFEQRQKERFARRNPRHLWTRACGKCGKEIHTTYAPDRPETVYCEKCYLEAVY